MRVCGPLRLRLRGDCGWPDISGACRAGMVPASRTEPKHVSSPQHSSRPKLNPRHPLMVCITVFQAGNAENSAFCHPPNMTVIPPPSSTSSTPSNPGGATVTPGGAETRTGFPLPPPIVFGYTRQCAVVVVEGAPV
jgi:hypothetical protein